MATDINNGLKPIRYKLYPFYTSDTVYLLDGRLGIVEEVVGALHPQERVKVHLGTVQDTDLLPGFKRLN